MIMDIESIMEFYFKVGKEAKFAKDPDGNPSECYLRIEFGFKGLDTKNIEAERERLDSEILRITADFLKVDQSVLTMVTLKEYLEETKDREPLEIE